jgi:putative SOS response-associated peptidase YedK
LVPSWAKDISIGNKLINARSESVHEKPSFRDSFKNKRCLIPATGFFEWRENPTKKKNDPYYIRTTNQPVFSFAGLWSSWTDKTTGAEVLSFTIITTEANEFLAEIHNRMPVILPENKESDWLNHTLDRDYIRSLMVSYPSDEMESFPVSTIVNSPRNDIPECIAQLTTLI